MALKNQRLFPTRDRPAVSRARLAQTGGITSSLLLTLALGTLALSSVQAQWSEPVPVPYESTWQNYQFIVTAGDTFRALWTAGFWGVESAVAYTAWSLGDSWSEPESIDCTRLAGCAAAGVDGEGHIWFLRFDGDVPWGGEEQRRWDQSYSVVASVRGSLGWRNLHEVLRASVPTIQYPARLEFAVDRNGQPWLGINEHVHEGSGQYNSARFGRLQGDTCTWPGWVVKGDTPPNCRWVSGPLLEPRPDSGMWSACEVVEASGRSWVGVHALWGDSAFLLHGFGGFLYDAAVDSTGRLWVVYSDTLWRLRSATVGVDSTVVHQLIVDRRGIPWDGVSVCIDYEGWVWCAWMSEDTSMMVSWNRGGAWSPPERAANRGGYYSLIVPDSRGLMHLYYGSYGGAWYGVRRLSRPGIEETTNDERGTMNAAPTIVRGVLFLPVSPFTTHPSLFSLDGRKVTDLQPGPNDVRHLAPGVYFVREYSAFSPQRSELFAVRKVVITE